MKLQEIARTLEGDAVYLLHGGADVQENVGGAYKTPRTPSVVGGKITSVSPLPSKSHTKATHWWGLRQNPAGKGDWKLSCPDLRVPCNTGRA